MVPPCAKLVVECCKLGFVCVCVDSASAALGLSHDGLSSHRAVLPVPLGAAVNKV